MTSRRFTDKPSLDPSAVWHLQESHPAIVESRTLFPSTVVTVDKDFTGSLLVSGINSRKLGKTITKGNFKGYELYSLTLEERATCPEDCSALRYCYGNGMQLARRHRIKNTDYFFEKLEAEIAALISENPGGIMVRLHVLGDFPSVEYTAFWADPVMREKMRSAAHESQKTQEYRARFSEYLTKRWQDPVMREKYTRANAQRNNPALRKKNSKRMKALWSDPVWRAKMVAKTRKARMISSAKQRAAAALKPKPVRVPREVVNANISKALRKFHSKRKAK